MIEVSGISKRFCDVVAVDGFDMLVARGSRVAMLGPSGCGKTTIMRIIAGLELPDAGSVRIGGSEVSAPGHASAPHTRGIGLVFQEPALFPHMTVARNVAYGLAAGGSAADTRVAEMLASTGLEGLGGRYPAELSGGQQRRVALARALAPAPARVLMDEPLTNLDAAARGQLLSLIDDLVARSGASLLYVTHDHDEAATLGCEVVRMEAGRRVG